MEGLLELQSNISCRNINLILPKKLEVFQYKKVYLAIDFINLAGSFCIVMKYY